MIGFSGVGGSGGEVRGTVEVGGERFEVWFRVSGARVAVSAEAFCVLALPLAMARGMGVVSPGPLTEGFVAGLGRWQEVFASWYPDRLVPVEVRAGRRRARRGSRGRACFFTGGVDSFFSVLRHAGSLDALVFVQGFDVPLAASPALREEVAGGVRAAASELGVPLVEVETNLRDLSDAMGSVWGTTYHGVALAAVAHLLAPSFGEVLVGGTHTYADLFPWGSHPLTDPLLSSDRVRLVHDGAEADRVDKTIAVAGSEVALRHLRVCWENREGAYNCGVCRKCVRTQISLRIAGRLEDCATLPHHIDLDEVRSTPLGALEAIAFHAEVVHHLRDLGTEPELLDACEEALRRLDPDQVRWGDHDWTAVLSLLSGGGRPWRSP